jgi:hypothetical protein
VEISTKSTIRGALGAHRGNYSLKTEEKTTSIIHAMQEANLNHIECLTDTTVHQQVCPKRIRGTDERFGKHSLERR